MSTIVNNSLNAPFPLSATQGGLGASSLTAHGIVVAEGSSAATAVVLGAGQVLIGTTSGDPVAAGLTGGTGINVATGNGTITISATLASSWNSVPGTTQAMQSENAYISNNAALTTYTLPGSASIGNEFIVLSAANNAGGFTVLTNSPQTIRFGNQVASTSVSSSAVGDSVTLVCVDATTAGSEVFQVIDAVGNLVLA